jgi:hypothetical protein
MKICVICFGPIESKSNGYFIRTWSIVNELSKKNKIVVLEFPEKKYIYDKKTKNIKIIKLLGNYITKKSRISNLLTFDPIHVLKFEVFSFFELIRKSNYIKESDIIFVEGGLIPFSFILGKIFRKKIIFDTGCLNVLTAEGFKKSKKVVYYLRKILWTILEYFEVKISDYIIVVSKDELNFLKYNWGFTNKKIFVVRNPVILENKKIDKKMLKKIKEKYNLYNKKVVLFIGNLKSVQNREAAKFIIKMAHNFLKYKDIVFLIVGEGNEQFEDYPENVIFTGYVDSVEEYIEISDLCIAPLTTGAGTKLKMLYYLKHNKKIVCTPKAIEGFEIKSKLIHICNIDLFEECILKTINKNVIERKNIIDEEMKKFKLELNNFISQVKKNENTLC